MAGATETNEYTPTPGELKLLEAMSDPANRLLNVTDLCQTAGISRDVYYKAFKKQGFVDLVKDTSLSLIKQHLVPIINSSVAAAKDGSFQDRKLLLEMAGLYVEKRQQELTGKGGGPVTVKFEGQLAEWSK